MIPSCLLVGFGQIVPHWGFSIVAFISRALIHWSPPLPTSPAHHLCLSLLPRKLFLVLSYGWVTSWPLRLASACFVVNGHISSFLDKFLGLLLIFILSADSPQWACNAESTCVVVTGDDLLGPCYYRPYLVSSLVFEDHP